jgi:nicotinamidase-related amidase
VCGQALSHCVAFTLRDIIQDWPATPEDRARISLLTDGTFSNPHRVAATSFHNT